MTASLVQLIDGKFVESDAEAWRLECEARYVALLDSHHEQEYLRTIETRRSPEAAIELAEKVAQVRSGATPMEKKV